MRVDVKTHLEFNSDKKMKLIGYYYDCAAV